MILSLKTSSRPMINITETHTDTDTHTHSRSTTTGPILGDESEGFPSDHEPCHVAAATEIYRAGAELSFRRCGGISRLMVAAGSRFSGYVCVEMGSQHTTARLDSAILGSSDGCSGRGGSMGSSRREWQHTAPCETEVLDPSWVLDGESKLDYSRPDAILGSCWVEQKGSASMLKGSTTNSVAAFLASNLYKD
ncbi:hypothetical protein OROHE_006152 [Orobanche hederae]